MADKIHASLKHFRESAQKVRLVADLIRGKKLDQALEIMKFTRKKAAKPIHKLLKSAEANAHNLGNVDIDNLYVKAITVDEAPTWKRIMPRAQGRATVIRKRNSHVTVVLAEKE